jgi:zinc transporter ZupT
MHSPLPLFLNLVTALSTIFLGFSLANFSKKKINIKTLNHTMALGAGFLLSIAFFELLPKAIKESSNIEEALKFVVTGIVLVFLFDRFLAPYLNLIDTKNSHQDDGCAHHHQYEHDFGHNHESITGPQSEHAHASCGHAIIGHGAACSAVGCLMCCAFFDGIAYSGAMISDHTLGVLIFFGQIFHVIPEGLMASHLVMSAQGNARSIKKAALLTGILFFLGSLIPIIFYQFSINHFLKNIQFYFLSISSGILLYVGLSQLLPSSVNKKSESIFILLGGIIFLLIHTIVGHHH